MADTMYYYAVARTRVKELSLLSVSSLEQLLACKNYEECLRFLREKGFGKLSAEKESEDIIEAEYQNAYQLFSELVKDEKILRVFQIPYDFHNVKVAIKLIYAESKNRKEKLVFLERGSLPSKEIFKAVQDRKFEILPSVLAGYAKTAYEDLLHTGDGQLCDIFLDSACLTALSRAGKDSKVELLSKYTEKKVAYANITIAYRACKAKKSQDFYEMALVPCETLSKQEIISIAKKGEEELISYLKKTVYAEGASMLKKSYAAFELWCDNEIMQLLKKVKHLPYTVAPVIAYYLARETEIKMVKLILSGKRNALPEQLIRERMRKLYV
ncbi:V-type ATPase subunit [Lachnoclostridium phytofermentans]|uniref:H+transporting two-sector ATPase C (AC39) subunit n=1 Tax=Lachnoclostridium phytofermentans (strain ATCC 700394 / DSM 18823 / ISDg) TaxID=357809 RepID=A9KQV2_LACP7|nr:V-type ATPase subunit [Lachnoclostridium phytofermentans]ABX43431.1 H+transporting two-sector ATPase C (AC39) subunit [Lachnoclostridium phytofermentans ISDg]